MNEIELAWAAGFFDGESHVGFYIENDRKRRIEELGSLEPVQNQK